MLGFTRISWVSTGRTIVVCPCAKAAKDQIKAAPSNSFAIFLDERVFEVRVLIIDILIQALSISNSLIPLGMQKIRDPVADRSEHNVVEADGFLLAAIQVDRSREPFVAV